ncbi:hypothetical protein Tco_1083812, partial [Tanacetum coccineum]
LGGVEKEMSLLELGWRVGLYSEGESRDVATLSGLRGAETESSWNSTRVSVVGRLPERLWKKVKVKIRKAM